MPKPTMLLVSDLKADATLQMRAEVSQARIDQYAAWLTENKDDDLDAIDAFEDAAGKVHIWDGGGHRLEAYRLAGRERIPCNLKKGEYRAAWVASLGANRKHGMERSAADVRKAVYAALDDAETSKQSQAAIAKLCGCSAATVCNIMAERAGKRPVGDGSTRKATNQYLKARQAEAQPEPKPHPRSGAVPIYDSGPYACPDCEHSFVRQLWHCPGCDAHWTPAERKCGRCGELCPYTEKELLAGERKPEILPMSKPPQKATAAAVVASTAAPAPSPVREPSPTDTRGRPVPPDLAEAFANVSRYRSFIQALGRLRTELDSLRDAPGGEYLQTTHKTAVADLDNLQSQLKFATPDCLCPKCDGGPPRAACDVCRGLGWLNESQSAHLTSEQKAKADQFAA